MPICAVYLEPESLYTLVTTERREQDQLAEEPPLGSGRSLFGLRSGLLPRRSGGAQGFLIWTPAQRMSLTRAQAPRCWDEGQKKELF